MSPDTLGQRLRRLRAIRNLTQRDLADFAGRSERWVRYLENDQARLDSNEAALLANGLRVSVAVVLGIDPIPVNLQDAADTTRSVLPIPVLGAYTLAESDLPPAVMRSQQQWHEVRRFLAHSGADLVSSASNLYDAATFIGASGAFARPDWLPAAPLDLQQLELTLTESPTARAITGTEPEARLYLPLHSPGHQYDRYSSAIRHLDRPRLFENRLSYRLLSSDTTDGGVRALRFGLGRYFDKVDVSETLVHEYAVAHIDRQRSQLSAEPSVEDLPFRALVGDPFDLGRRPVLPGVVTLTLQRSTSGDTAAMLLHLRDPSKVAIGGRVHTLIPSGEFQPSSIAPASYEADLDLWRNIVREYSEELLDMPEHDGSGSALDYDAWPLYRMLTDARRSGRIRAYFLGIAINPLSLGADLLTAVVFDATAFESAFPIARRSNSEGLIVRDGIGSPTAGLPFDQDSVGDLLSNRRLAPSSAACLALAWRHRRAFLQS